MSILALIVLIIVLGVGLYFFNKYFTTIDAGSKRMVNIVVIVIEVLLVLYAFGILQLFERILNTAVPKV